MRADDAHAKRGDVVGLNDPIIKTEAGIALTVAGFSGWMRKAITAAGLPLGCKVHRLRHPAGLRLVEADCTDEQAMAMLGHTSSTSLRIYTKGPRNSGSLATRRSTNLNRAETGLSRTGALGSGRYRKGKLQNG